MLAGLFVSSIRNGTSQQLIYKREDNFQVVPSTAVISSNTTCFNFERKRSSAESIHLLCNIVPREQLMISLAGVLTGRGWLCNSGLIGCHLDNQCSSTVALILSFEHIDITACRNVSHDCRAGARAGASAGCAGAETSDCGIEARDCHGSAIQFSRAHGRAASCHHIYVPGTLRCHPILDLERHDDGICCFELAAYTHFQFSCKLVPGGRSGSSKILRDSCNCHSPSPRLALNTTRGTVTRRRTEDLGAVGVSTAAVE
mmetsp:Transcript_28789/g.46308  ORF Transcript_28789/g.46308 Transcript_28789/m.46308 type:complete len:258 (-) Transcript_28789:40-813(-)